MSSTSSLHTLVRTAGAAVRRFPIEIATAVVGTVTGLLLANQSLSLAQQDQQAENGYLIIILACVVHLFLHLAVSIAYEYGTIQRTLAVALRALATAAAVGTAMTIDLNAAAAPVQILTICLGALALVTIAPFRRGANACWSFTRMLVQRIAVSAIFTGVCILGINLALQSMQMLLGLHTEPYFMHVAVIFLGLFNTMVVLTGIPHATDVSDEIPLVPQVLQWLTLFILIPLVTIYVVILSIHGFTVLVLNDFNGSVAAPALGFGIVSLVTWLLAWPLHEHAPHRVARVYVRWLGVALIPITTMLTIAIAIRVMEYGVTPERHVVMLLTLFMITMNVALLVTRRLDVRFLPAVMVILAMLGGVGPLDSASLSARYEGHDVEPTRDEAASRDAAYGTEIDIHPPIYEPLQVKGHLEIMNIASGAKGFGTGRFVLSKNGVRDSIDMRALPALYRDSANAAPLSRRRLVSINGHFSAYPVIGLLIMQGDTLAWYDMKCLVIRHE